PAITQQAAPSPGARSPISWAWRRGTTSRWPGTIGAMSMIARAVPSEYTTDAGALPSTIWQKTQSAIPACVYEGSGGFLRVRFGRSAAPGATATSSWGSADVSGAAAAGVRLRRGLAPFGATGVGSLTSEF